MLAEKGIVYGLRDVDTDENLKKLFTFRVPVLMKDGRVLLEGKFTPERLSRKLSV